MSTSNNRRLCVQHEQLSVEHYERMHKEYHRLTSMRRFYAEAVSETNGMMSIPPEYQASDGSISKTAIFFTDGSLKDYASSAAVVWQKQPLGPRGNPKPIWKYDTEALGRFVGDSNDAELYAVFLAFRTAVKHHQAGYPFNKVVIFSDSKTIINMLDKGMSIQNRKVFLGPLHEHDTWVLERLYDRADILHEAGINVTIRWIKGHDTNDGNNEADRRASERNDQQILYLEPYDIERTVDVPTWVSKRGELVKKEYLYRQSAPWFRHGVGRNHLISVIGSPRPLLGSPPPIPPILPPPRAP
jgi:ribonuclease HI